MEWLTALGVSPTSVAADWNERRRAAASNTRNDESGTLMVLIPPSVTCLISA
jgi:hypothetical protein